MEEKIWGAPTGEALASLIVKALKPEALLEVAQAASANLIDYEASRSTKNDLQKSLWRDRLDYLESIEKNTRRTRNRR